MINESIKKIVSYALEKNLIKEEDRIFCINSILAILHLNEYVEPEETYSNVDLESSLKEILDWAYENHILPENTTVYRDLLDTKIMGVFVDKPSEINEKFNALYEQSPSKATEWFYQFCKDIDYIRDYRVKKDLKWQTSTDYGDIDITINLSKPEKDPKAIAAATQNTVKVSYPKCQLCPTNLGYEGRIDHPARENLRIIPLSFEGQKYYFQYSPYSYFNEHAIVFNEKHIPMVINHDCFEQLINFVRLFPHYMLGSNADLPIVGGSILTHDHYQGGNYIFPLFRAEEVEKITFDGFEDIEAKLVKWPLTDIRISSSNYVKLINLADKILNCWRGYTDKEAYIYAYTDGVPHNTITPIAHKVGSNYVLELVLRNNITTGERPLGLYHPSEDLWHIKKENIGLIEVMGLAVLPSRLKRELDALALELVDNIDPANNQLTEKHAEWAKMIKAKYPSLNRDNVNAVIRKEVGLVFLKCLECCGVYKQTKEGLEGFNRFVDFVNSK